MTRIIKAVLHRPYKHFSAAFEELKGDQCDSQVSAFTWLWTKVSRDALDYSLQNYSGVKMLSFV